MRHLKQAFGSPDAAFHDRVRETLFRIEEKEEKPVKKKLTLSMALAFALCLCIVTATALGASDIFPSPRPDETLQPLSHAESTGSPSPEDASGLLLPVYMDRGENPVFHSVPDCQAAPDGAALAEVCLCDALLDGALPCEACRSIPCYTEAGDQETYHLFIRCPLLTAPAQDAALLTGRTLCGGCAVLLMDRLGEIQFLYSEPIEAESTPMPTVTPMPTATPDAPQPTPLPTGGTEMMYFWSAEGEEFYHADQNCSGTDTPQRTLLAVALNRSQTACPLCMNAVPLAATPMPTPASTPTPTPMPTQTPPDAAETVPAEDTSLWYADLCIDTVHVAADDGLYHTHPACAALDGRDHQPAHREVAIVSGRTACPECQLCFMDLADSDLYHMFAGCPSAGDPAIRYNTIFYTPGMTLCGECAVYSAPSASYYHADASCPAGPASSAPCSRLYAATLGQTACPECLSEERYEKTGASAPKQESSARHFTEWIELDLSFFEPCPEITLHSASLLRTRGCLYAEFAFTPADDQSILPHSVSVIPVRPDGTEAQLLSREAVEELDADGETVYLLCEVMQPFPNDSAAIGSLRIYGSSAGQTNRLIAELR